MEKQTQLAGFALILPTVWYASSIWLPVIVPQLSITLWGVIGLLYVRILFQLLHTAFFHPLLSLPPAPENTLIFGHTLAVLQRPSVETVLRWMKSTKSDGMLRISDLYHRKLGIIVTSPEVAYEILTTKATNFEKPQRVRNWLWTLMGSGGLISAEGHEHTVQRKALARVFTNTSTRDLVPLFWSKAQRLTDVISDHLANQQAKTVADKAAETGVVNLAPLSAGVTLDIISVAIFGRDLDCVSNAAEPMHRAWAFLSNPDASGGGLSTYFVVSALFPTWLTRYFPCSFVNTFNGHRRFLRQLCLDIVHERRSKAYQEEDKDILSLLVKEEKATESTNAQNVDQMLTLLAAGHDTTSGTFLWAAWLLSLHTDVQARVRAEVQSVLSGLQERNEEFDARSSDMLTYTTAVANEVMRMFPTVAMTVRESQANVEINGLPVPKGTRMYISPWALQRMPDSWGEDAGDFKPDRWLDDSQELDHTGGARAPHAFLTFLNGPRACIGQHFARNELLCLMVALVSKFEFARLDDDDGKLRMTGIITIQPKDGMRLKFKEIRDT